ncbi:MAG: hypothetical protein ACW99G_23075 [Candidatus Thorarchaeota archaeon]|jgi:hypothetical protein
MAETLQQTDTVATAGDCSSGVLCSGNSNNTDFNSGSNQAEKGGTAGSTGRVITMDVSAIDLNAVWMECIMPSGYDGATGDWTINLNISAGNHQISLDEIHVCRVNSSCTNQESLASSVGIGQNLQNTGDFGFTVTQSSTSAFAAGDKSVVIFAFDNAQAMTQAITYVPSLTIVAPGTGTTVEPDQFYPTLADFVFTLDEVIPSGIVPPKKT